MNPFKGKFVRMLLKSRTVADDTTLDDTTLDDSWRAGYARSVKVD